MTDPSHIPNFSIIAHIDHGKSTLSDRVLGDDRTPCRVAGYDRASCSIQHGHRARARHHHQKPGRARATTPPTTARPTSSTSSTRRGTSTSPTRSSRSLAACEGAVLVVDATQGVEAQTVANAMMAMNANLEIIPLINKIDLPSGRPRTRRAPRSRRASPFPPTTRCSASAARPAWACTTCSRPWSYNIPAPQGDADAPLRALIFDSYFDPYRGVVALVRVVDGSMRKGQNTQAHGQQATSVLAEEVGARRPAEDAAAAALAWARWAIWSPASRTFPR